MPTNPTTPNSSAAIDRLALGVDTPRGANPSWGGAMCYCFEAGSSAAIFGCYGSACFEAEASVVCQCSWACHCFEVE